MINCWKGALRWWWYNLNIRGILKFGYCCFCCVWRRSVWKTLNGWSSWNSRPSFTYLRSKSGETVYYVGEDTGESKVVENGVGRERAVCFENAIRQAMLPLTPQSSNESSTAGDKKRDFIYCCWALGFFNFCLSIWKNLENHLKFSSQLFIWSGTKKRYKKSDMIRHKIRKNSIEPAFTGA